MNRSVDITVTKLFVEFHIGRIHRFFGLLTTCLLCSVAHLPGESVDTMWSNMLYTNDFIVSWNTTYTPPEWSLLHMFWYKLLQSSYSAELLATNKHVRPLQWWLFVSLILTYEYHGENKKICIEVDNLFLESECFESS